MTVALHDALPGLDRRNADLVLAAVAHAAGTHEHRDVIAGGALGNDDGSLPSLHPWPATGTGNAG